MTACLADFTTDLLDLIRWWRKKNLSVQSPTGSVNSDLFNQLFGLLSKPGNGCGLYYLAQLQINVKHMVAYQQRYPW